MFNFDNLTREECKAVIARARARMKQLRIQDPFVYGVKMVSAGQTRYHTCVPGMGMSQLLATDLQHSALWLTSSREWAEEHKTAFAKAQPGQEWEVVAIPKTEAIKLPCYAHQKYGDDEEMV